MRLPNLYVLGAGCSKNYSQSTRGIRGLESPKNDDFFRMAHLVIENTGMKSDPSFMEQIHLLVKTIAPLYGEKSDLSLFSKRNLLRLEEVMTLLDIDFRLFSPLTAQRLGHNESAQMRTLKDLLARTLEYALEGPPCRKHSALAKRMGAGDVVVSLNYDILIDNALSSLGKITDSGYGMNFFKVNQDGEWIGPSQEYSEVSLLKLHGSLNWIKCGLCGVLLLYRSKKQTLGGFQEFLCPRCSADANIAERMIIPPIQSKDYRDKDMAFLWVQADRMMKEFSRVICIGYSFSPLDFDMTSIMRRLRTKQTSSPEVDFISPDDDAEKRLRCLFGIARTNRFPDLSDYLEST